MLDGEPSTMDGTVVRFVDKQQKWGAVRVMARMLALAVNVHGRDGGHAVRVLTTYGGEAVHKVYASAPGDHPGSWIIGDVEEIARLRQGEDVPARHQLDPDARTALIEGDLEKFLTIQDMHVLEIERRLIEEYCLQREAPES